MLSHRGDAALSGEGRLSSASPVRALPVTGADIMAAVTVVQAMPGVEWCGWQSVASATVDCISSVPVRVKPGHSVAEVYAYRCSLAVCIFLHLSL